MSLKFIIASRPYNHQSFGVVTLHKMHEFLLKNGFESEIIFFDGFGKDYKWIFSTNELNYRKSNLINKNRNYKNYLKEVCEKGIIVYPEVIYGNPLSGKNIVRYLLNKERVLKPWGMNASKQDFFLVYSKLYRKNFHHELFNPPSIEWLKELKINNFNTRKIDVTYIGKGIKYGANKIILNTVEITREWPPQTSDLILLLNNTRYFFCFDTLSGTQMTALLCGAVPFVFELGPFKISELINSELPFFTGKASLNEDYSINKLSYDHNEFTNKREESIRYINKLNDQYETKLLSFVKKIIIHFKISNSKI